VKILYVAPRYDYGDPSRGSSLEHNTFYDCLRHMGHQILYVDSLSEFQERGRASLCRKLRDIAGSERPDLLFCVLFKDELDIDVISHISRQSDTVTFNWFCDDHWRFEGFSRHWAPAFNFVATTARDAPAKYAAIGYHNVVKTQWGCNHFLYRPLGHEPEIDVTFVGQPYGKRRELIDLLRKAGIDVRTWGHGWEAGRLSQEELIAVFNRSRISLNFPASSTHGTTEPRWRRGIRRITCVRRHLPGQIKARNFEVPGCGGFLLTGVAENLADFYAFGAEIATFRSGRGLVRQVKHYLEHEAERRGIAEAGYRRTIAEHTMERRLNEVFIAMGLTSAITAPEPS
jgi:spore maturation protein CgeB